jgi:hypothetical protein
MKNKGGKVATVMIRGHIPFCVTPFHWKNSNSHNSKSTYSHDTIKVILEIKWNAEHEIMRNKGGKVAKIVIRHHTL